MASSVVISAPNAVLGIPRDVWGINSGVTEATDSACSCTGWTFAHGDGVTKVFELPSLVTSLSALYRRDWQGCVALSSGARTNLLTYSQDFSNAAWPKSNVSIGVSTTAPDGTTTAILLVEGSNNGSHYLNRAGATSGTQQVFSVYAKAGTRTQIALQLGGLAAYFDLSTGAIISGFGASIFSIGDGWYRCILTNTPSNNNSLLFVSKSGSVSYQGDGASGVYLWGAQLEAGTTPTPYIPTTSAPVTLTDYAATGNTITLAEAPLLGSDLSVDADLVPHTCLSFNHGGRR